MGDFTIAWSLTERRDPLIILLGGTSGIYIFESF
jgi:hypothetical protein